jgi:CobQ-like glutamine amidotransferase family enzyme
LQNDKVQMNSQIIEKEIKKVDISDEVADDLELLIFGGNADLPANMLNHLPAIGI